MSKISDYILEAEGIRKYFGGVKALKGVDISIKKGEIHALAGENGSGKSVLIKILSGFYVPDEGGITIDGIKYKKLSSSIAISKGIQVIYQDLSLFPNLTVMENLSLNSELMNKRKFINYKRLKIIANEALSTIDFKVDLNENVENLSIADKQLIAISRALLHNARLIIMDEPTTALTKREINNLFNIIRQLKSEGIAFLFVSHKLDEVFEISESFTILRSGGKIITGETRNLDRKKFAYYMTGREFEEVSYFPNTSGQDVMLEVKNLSQIGNFSNISFKLRKNEILGITGLLGSGRRELALAIFGINPPDSGQMFMEGKILRIKNVTDALKYKIGYVPEDRLTEGLFLPQTIERNLTISILKKFSSRLGVLKNKNIKTEVDFWVNKLSIKTENTNNPIQTLSGGNQQKVVLSRWLANNLKVLILSSPTFGVDIGAKYDIHQILRDLAKEGLAIIVISDDLHEIMSICNRIIVMKNGKISNVILTSEINEKKLAELSISD